MSLLFWPFQALAAGWVVGSLWGDDDTEETWYSGLTAVLYPVLGVAALLGLVFLVLRWASPAAIGDFVKTAKRTNVKVS